MAEPDEQIEYGIMLDCDKQGCVAKQGFRHGDHGMVSPRRPSRAQIEEYKVDGRWLINEHAATLVYRTFSPWEPVLLIDGPGTPQWEDECEEFGCWDDDDGRDVRNERDER